MSSMERLVKQGVPKVKPSLTVKKKRRKLRKTKSDEKRTYERQEY